MATSQLNARGEASFDFYPYNPSKSAGVAFVILFVAGTVAHMVQLIMFRSWFFIPFLLGCLAEVGGYYGRAWAHNNIRQSNPYLLQLFLIIGATPLLSASIYMTLSRIIRALDATKYSLIRVSWLSKIYVLIDIVCLVLQVMGTVMIAYGGSGERQKAINFIAGGLIFQLVAFVVFILLASTVHGRLATQPSTIAAHPRIHWRRCFWVLYIASILILVRNLVRVLEFLQGSDSVIARNEIFLYIFDACPMFLAVLLIATIHPGRLIRSAHCLSRLEGHGTIAFVPLPRMEEGQK